MLTQPLYRFADDKAGVIDGGLFAFVVSNDPELFLMLEVVNGMGGSEAHWKFSLARMSSLKMAVRLGDREVWTVPNYWREPTEDRRTGPYVESKFGTFPPDAAATAEP
jgi:hypothetical protein